jgi:general secretion pathway protein D
VDFAPLGARSRAGPPLDLRGDMTRRGVAITGVPWLAISLLAGVRPTAAEPGEGHPPAAELSAGDEPPFRCKAHPGKVVVTFKADADVKDLVTWVMGFTCKNVLVDPRVGATNRRISIITPSAMSPDDAYQVFLAALATIGLTAVARGDTLRIVEANGAHKEAVPLLHAGTPGDTDQYVRYVYKPSFVTAEQLHTAYTAMKSDAGDAFTLGQVVVMTDYASHVREMLAFARLVDVPGGSDGIYTLPVHHADAARLAEKLNAILGPAPAAPAPIRPGPPDPSKLDPGKAAVAAVPSKIVVDERTNTLIIAASDAGYQRVKALVERLDIALEMEGGSAIHVYPLGSAIAEELARTLTLAISDGRTARPPGSTGPGAGGLPGSGGPAAGGPPRSGPGAASPPATSPDAALDGLGAAIEGQVRVIADPPTNALIVIANARDFLAIREVILQLDLPRRQVYIETVILDVDVTAHDQLGTVAHAGSTIGQDGSVLFGGVKTSDVNSLDLVGALSKTAGLFTGVLGSPLPGGSGLFGQSVPSFAVLFRAVADHSNAHVVSTPSIIAVDNVEAKYNVGTTIPVQKGFAFAPLGGGAAPPGTATASIDHEELPLTLNIKPHISNDDSVLLEVTYEEKELTGDPNTLNPSWIHRNFATRVVVRDQQTVVLGGLSQDRELISTSKIPLLGDIPLLGYLFKTTTRTKQRTNLIVVLTPYIIRHQADLYAIRERKLREYDEFARSMSGLSHMAFQPDVDYRKKRGLVEEINRAVLDAEHDAAARAALDAHPPGVAAGSVEPPREP